MARRQPSRDAAGTGPSREAAGTGPGRRTAAAGAGDAAESSAAQLGRRGRTGGLADAVAKSDSDISGSAAAGLPPLRQPTGELPVVSSSGPRSSSTSSSDADADAGQDASNDWPTDLPATGTFEANGTDADRSDEPNSDPLADLDAGERSIDLTMPSTLSVAGSARAAGRGGRGSAGSAVDGLASDARAAAFDARPTDGDARSAVSDARSAVGDARSVDVRSAGADATAVAATAFPDVDGLASESSFPSWTSAKAEASSSSSDETLAMGSMAGGRGVRPGARQAGGSSDRRPNQSAGSQGQRTGPRSAGAQRLQETEIKLAGRQSAPPKPREPNRLLLGLALALVVLAGAAVAWWLMREDDPNQSADADQEQVAETNTTLADGEAAAPVTEAPAVEEPVLDVPTLSLVDVDAGPLDSATTYSLDLFGEPAGSLLQVVVDDVPQGQPDPGLPDLILPAGRHTLVVNVSDAAGARTSTPVEVYVLDAPPAEGHIANLASIDIANEGWDEAIRRFDEYRAAGHQNVRILPITPGFWNIFIPELGDAAGATTYCESFGLAVPDDCFPRLFDPATYQPPVAPAPADTGTDAADEGAMTDEGEADTSTSTTTGG